MRGVVLAGGRGTRLKELTRVVNKHLLPVYNRPMIYYPLQILAANKIREVMIVTNPQHVSQLHDLLGTQWGGQYGDQLLLSYAVQTNPTGGIADAISLAQGFAKGGPITVVLGDNIFKGVEIAEVAEPSLAQIYVKRVRNPQQYGVVEMLDNIHVRRVVEKPANPVSDYAQTGLYVYGNSVFDKINLLSPSERGELEVTDLNNLYANEHKLVAEEVSGPWIDAGTSADELLRASHIAREVF